MNAIDVLNVSVGGVSLILGFFAILLSVYFFMKAKDSEKETARTLEAIKVQTEALQKLTGRWMDRLTRYATEPRPADEGLMQLVSAMANLPTTILTHLRVTTTTQPASSNDEALIGELVDSYIALYYYVAIANVTAQTLLPSMEAFDASVPEHSNVKRLVDQTLTDFQYITNLVASVHASRLSMSRVRHLYEDARVNWGPLVRNADSAWASRSS